MADFDLPKAGFADGGLMTIADARLANGCCPACGEPRPGDGLCEKCAVPQTTERDARAIDALIAELDAKVRSPGVYTSQDATEFARRWKEERADGKQQI